MTAGWIFAHSVQVSIMLKSSQSSPWKNWAEERQPQGW